MPSSLYARLSPMSPREPYTATEPYLEFLRGRANKVFYRLPYPGNAGDSLIQFATQVILGDLQIRTTVDPRKADVILVPGGNPTMWPTIGPQQWQILWKRYPQAEFIVGPAGFRSGYSDWARIIDESGGKVSGLFARDPESFQNLNAADLGANIVRVLSHDPALFLRHSKWMAAHREAATEEYDVAIFRDDHEANLKYSDALRGLRRVLPTRIYDRLVRRGAHAAKSRKLHIARRTNNSTEVFMENDLSRQRFEVFVEGIRAARAVHTDRLHAMLLAAMLGKKIFAYPTAHGKLEGVYRHSLQGWTDVTLIES